MTKTLLELAGAPRRPGSFDESALLLIDAQLEYVTGVLPLDGVDAAVAEAVRLLTVARERGAPVFHIVHHARPGAAAFDPDGVHAAIIPALAPKAREQIVIKALPNAFAGTDLDSLIRETGRRSLIIAGFATHMCVSSTTRAALDLGYRSTVVAAATATRDLPSAVGSGVVSAAMIQEATLAALADRFAIIAPDTAGLQATTDG